jgi:hypothetical protein
VDDDTPPAFAVGPTTVPPSLAARVLRAADRGTSADRLAGALPDGHLARAQFEGAVHPPVQPGDDRLDTLDRERLAAHADRTDVRADEWRPLNGEEGGTLVSVGGRTLFHGNYPREAVDTDELDVAVPKRVRVPEAEGDERAVLREWYDELGFADAAVVAVPVAGKPPAAVERARGALDDLGVPNVRAPDLDADGTHLDALADRDDGPPRLVDSVGEGGARATGETVSSAPLPPGESASVFTLRVGDTSVVVAGGAAPVPAMEAAVDADTDYLLGRGADPDVARAATPTPTRVRDPDREPVFTVTVDDAAGAEARRVTPDEVVDAGAEPSDREIRSPDYVPSRLDPDEDPTLDGDGRTR